MMYRLRYLQHDLELSEGQFTIGRSAACQLSLDDPLISRTHARLRVTADGVLLEDLGSRNGVLVNGERLHEPRILAHGDHITIGNQQLQLVHASLTTDTAAQRPATHNTHSFGVIANLAEKALALGRIEEAERLLNPQLQQLLSDLQGGNPASAAALTRASQSAVKLASATGKGLWIDYIVRLYAQAEQPIPAELIDELYSVLRRVNQIDLRGLREYLDVLRSRASEWSPAERFLVSRIEGLERLALAT